MKTQDEIVAAINDEKGPLSDFFGVRKSDAIDFLDIDHARQLLKEGETLTQEEWEKAKKPLTEEGVKSAIAGYMPFAFEKANDMRGLSANRSIDHMMGWLWILGDEELYKRIEGIEYEHYGKEKLIAICEHFGIDHAKLNDGVLTNGN